MNEVVKCPRCGQPMAKGRLYSYQGLLNTGPTPIFWAEEGNTSWRARVLINVSEDATAYLCKNCWITVLDELGDRRNEPSNETEFAKALREQNRRNKT
jgi:hypothetical protein